LVESTDWLARGGAYYVLAFVWLGSAGYFYYLAAKLGNQIGKSNDGCLYGICNIILALFGGGIGLLALLHHYPFFILSSIISAIAFPTVGTLYIVRRTRSKE